MLKRYSIAQLVLVCLLCSLEATASDSWVDESNTHSAIVMNAQARFQPETFSALGIESADADIFDLMPRLYQRSQQDTQRLVAVLEERKRSAEDPRVLQDLDILIQSLHDQYHTTELNQQYLLPYFNLSQTLYFGFQSLLDPRNDPARFPAALERLRKYTGQAKGTRPITELARERSSERFDQPGLLGPFRG